MKTYSYKKAILLLLVLGLFSSPSYAFWCSAKYESIAEALAYENISCAKRLIEGNDDPSITYDGYSALSHAYFLSKEWALKKRIHDLQVFSVLPTQGRDERDRTQRELRDLYALLAEEEADGIDFDDPVAEDVYNMLLAQDRQ